MNQSTLFFLFLIFIGVFICIYFTSSRSDKYKYLSNLYSPLDGGVYSEYNEECMDNENRHCVLTNGMTGKCILNGQCMVSALVDHRQEAEEIHKPYCTKPYSAKGCTRFCNCVQDPKSGIYKDDIIMAGNNLQNCNQNCKSWFHPYFRV